MTIPHYSHPGAMPIIAEALFGPEWRRPLAAALASFRPRKPGRAVDDSTMYAWSSGATRTPQWVLQALPHVAADVAHKHRRDAKAALEIAMSAAGVSVEEVDAVRRAEAGRELARLSALAGVSKPPVGS